MKTKSQWIIILSLLVFFIGSCVPSLHPLYTPEDLIFEQKLLGAWMDDDSVVWEFEKYTPSTTFFSKSKDTTHYKLTVHDQKPAKFDLHLFKLGKYLYFDFLISEYKIENEMADAHLFPVHTFARAKIEKDSVTIEHFNIDFIENLIKEKKIRIKHEIADDRVILTAGTEELQKFVLKYADHDELYAENPRILKPKS